MNAMNFEAIIVSALWPNRHTGPYQVRACGEGGVDGVANEAEGLPNLAPHKALVQAADGPQVAQHQALNPQHPVLMLGNHLAWSMQQQHACH